MSRKRMGSLPALLLDLGPPPYQLPAARHERLAGSSARERVLGYVHEANRYEQGSYLLGACVVPVSRGSLAHQVPRASSGLGFLDVVVDHSDRGGLDHAARRHQGWVLQGGLEVSGP